MSAQQNIKIAQDGYAAFLRGDIPGVLALLDENIEWVTPATEGLPESGTRHGHAAVLEFFHALGEGWHFDVFEPREYIASGDLVAVQGYYCMRSRATGLGADVEWVMVWRFREGKCVRFQEYTDTAAIAHAAMGTQAAGR
jgi:uncharacterized protein